MKNWIHHFVHVTTIISFLDITSYGRVDFSEDTSGLLGQINMFRSIAKSSWFGRTSIVLFLNDVDVFKGKLKRMPLSSYLPEY